MISFKSPALFLIVVAVCGYFGTRSSAEQNSASESLPTIETLRERWKSECEKLDAFHMVVDFAYVQPRNESSDLTIECVRNGGKRLKEENGIRTVYNPDDGIGFKLQRTGKTESPWVLLTSA